MRTRRSIRIAALLRQLPISLRDLALRAGVSPSLLSRMRSGERAATPAMARRLAKALRDVSRTAGALATQLERAARMED